MLRTIPLNPLSIPTSNNVIETKDKTNISTKKTSENDIIDSDDTTEKMVKSFNDLLFSGHVDDSIKPHIKQPSLISNKTSGESINNNILNIPSQNYSGEILVNIDKNDKRFKFYDKSQLYLGSFSIDELMKYISHKYDPKNQFLPFVKSQAYDEAVNVIKKMIGSVKYNKNLKYAYIDLLNYNESLFMGDITSLVKLNNMLHTFEKETLDNALASVDSEYAKKIRQFIKKFIYILLNYTLQLISETSEIIMYDESKKKLKDELIKYSTGIVFRISQYVQEQLKILTDKMNEIEKIVDLNIKTTRALENKIDDLSQQYATTTIPPITQTIPVSSFPMNNSLQIGGTLIPSDNQHITISYSPYDTTRKYYESSSESDSSDSNYSAIENFEI